MRCDINSGFPFEFNGSSSFVHWLGYLEFQTIGSNPVSKYFYKLYLLRLILNTFIHILGQVRFGLKVN